ncbi:MAG: toxin C-terminal domain-containing protein [Propionibacteriaceae bacterium]|jgi:RHS repeat-associated protein|nr:toxin C-terminal domain-containing protein [Propionibacteriaceae bacterium]
MSGFSRPWLAPAVIVAFSVFITMSPVSSNWSARADNEVVEEIPVVPANDDSFTPVPLEDISSDNGPGSEDTNDLPGVEESEDSVDQVSDFNPVSVVEEILPESAVVPSSDSLVLDPNSYESVSGAVDATFAPLPSPENPEEVGLLSGAWMDFEPEPIVQPASEPDVLIWQRAGGSSLVSLESPSDGPQASDAPVGLVVSSWPEMNNKQVTDNEVLHPSLRERIVISALYAYIAIMKWVIRVVGSSKPSLKGIAILPVEPLAELIDRVKSLQSVQLKPEGYAINVGLTPVLVASVVNDVEGVLYAYQFTVCPGNTSRGLGACEQSIKPVAQSGWTGPEWRIPEGVLSPDSYYTWTVSVGEVSSSGVPEAASAYNAVRAFSTGGHFIEPPMAAAPSAPSLTLQSPSDGAILSTVKPTLAFSYLTPASGTSFSYSIYVDALDKSLAWQTPPMTSNKSSVSYTLPNLLFWNRGYSWQISAAYWDLKPNIMYVALTPKRTFYPIVPVASEAKIVSDRLAPMDHSVSIASGAYSISVSDASIPIPGGSLAVVRSYRSVDTAVRVLGSGWASILDMSISTPAGAAGPIVRFADGHAESFGTNPNGSYASAPGNLGTTLVKASASTWQVVDDSGFVYTLDSKGLVSMQGGEGAKVTVARNSTGQITAIKDVLSNRALSMTWTGSHVTKIAATPAPSGVSAVWTYQYSGDRLVKACSPYSGTTTRCTSYVYGSSSMPNAITQITEANGAITKISYVNGGVVTSVTDAVNSVWSFSRKSVTGSTEITATAPGSIKTVYIIDSMSRITRLVNALGGVQTWTYDNGGRLAKYSDPDGELAMTFDDEGRVLSRMVWRGSITYSKQYYTYWTTNDAKKGKLRTISDPRSSLGVAPLVSYAYDSKGRVTQAILGPEATGVRTKYAYTTGTESAVGGGVTPAGLLASVTDPMGAVTKWAYASNGLVRTQTSPSGLVTSYAYDSLGRLASESASVSGVERKNSYTYYDNGLSRAVTGPSVRDSVTGSTRQGTVITELDAVNLPVRITTKDLMAGSSQTVALTYDKLGHITKVVGPDGVTQSVYAYDARGNLTSETDARGAVTKHTYDVLGRVIKSVASGYKDPNVTTTRDVTLATYTWTASGRVATVSDVNGLTRAYSYTRDGLITSVVAKGVDKGKDLVEMKTSYDAMGNPIMSSYNNSTSTWVGTYDSLGQLSTSVVNGALTEYSYDAAGRMTMSRLRTLLKIDSTTTFTYDKAGRVTAVTEGSPQRITRYAYNEAGEVTGITDPRSSTAGAVAWTTNYTYDATGRVVQVVAPSVTLEGKTQRPTTKTGYDVFGRPVKQVAPNGAITTATYDAAGRVTKIVEPSVVLSTGKAHTPTSSWTYNGAGDVVSETRPDGLKSTFTYDNWGRLVKEVAPASTSGGSTRVSTWAYSNGGIPVSMIDPQGRKVTQTVNNLGQIISQSVYEGSTALTSIYQYNISGNLIKVTDPLGKSLTIGYDANQQVTSVKDADGVTSAYSYDVAGRTTKVESGGQTAVMEYNGLGHMVAMSHVTAGGLVTMDTTKYTYDVVGNVLSVAGPLGTGYSSTWDALNNMRSYTEGAAKTQLDYDLLGNLVKMVDPRGNTTTMGYNARRQLISVVEPSTTSHPNAADRTWTNAYDVMGQAVQSIAPGAVKTTRTFNSDGQILTESASGGGVVSASRSFTYDATGLLTAEATPKGNQTFAYNGRGLMKSSAGPLGTSSFTYDNAGRVTSINDPSGTTALTWTAAGRLASATTSGVKREFTYNGSGQLTALSHPGGKTIYSYDGAGRLSGETVTKGLLSVVYGWTGTYDQAGRLVKQEVKPASVKGAGVTSYTYNTSSRLTGWTDPSGGKHSFAYDLAGNLTNNDGLAATYDQRNRLSKMGTTSYTWSPRGTQTQAGNVGYSWDGFDRLTAAGSSKYTYDSLDRLVSLDNSSFTYAGANLEPAGDGSSKWTRVGDQLLAVNQKPVVQDHHGDVRATIGGDGSIESSASWKPYGSILEGSTTSALGFQGQWTSATSLVHMQARWYDSTTGSFLSRDQATLPVTQANRYQYAGGNPINNADPTGQTVCALAVPSLPTFTLCVAASVGSIAAGSSASGAVSMSIASGTAAGTVSASIAGGAAVAGTTAGGSLALGAVGAGVGVGLFLGWGIYASYLTAEILRDGTDLFYETLESPLYRDGADGTYRYPYSPQRYGSYFDYPQYQASIRFAAEIYTNSQAIIKQLKAMIARLADQAISEMYRQASYYVQQVVAQAMSSIAAQLERQIWEWEQEWNKYFLDQAMSKWKFEWDDLSRPIGVLPIDLPRLCESSSSAETCKGSALDHALGDMGKPVDLITSFAPIASLPDDPSPGSNSGKGESQTDQAPAEAARTAAQNPSSDSDTAPAIPRTNKEATEAAKSLGFWKLRGPDSHGQAIFTNGKVVISLDKDRHNGGVWKMAKTREDLKSKSTRMGTYDGELNRIGD